MGLLSGLGKVAGLGFTGNALGALMGGDDPYKQANKYWGQIPGRTQQYYNPYINAGQNALGSLQGEYGNLLGNRQGLQDQYGRMTGMGQGVMDQYGQLMNDPTAVMNKIGSQYQQSPGYQFQMDQAMNAVGNAAAAGGMAGSPQHQQQAATLATGLANQDYHNFLNQGLGLYGQGLQGGAGMFGAGLAGQQGMYNQGLAGQQGINQMGFGANDQMARIIADMLAQQGQGAFAGQAAQNQNKGQMWGNLAGLAGSLFSGGMF